MPRDLPLSNGSLLAAVGGPELRGDERPAGRDRPTESEIIFQSSRRLFALLNDLLQVSRLEAGRLELSPEPVRLQDLIPPVVEALGPVADNNWLRVTVRDTGIGIAVEDIPHAFWFSLPVFAWSEQQYQ